MEEVNFKEDINLQKIDKRQIENVAKEVIYDLIINITSILNLNEVLLNFEEMIKIISNSNRGKNNISKKYQIFKFRISNKWFKY